MSDNPGSAYRTVDNFNELTTTLFPECATLDDLFMRTVRLYGSLKCLGTRELLSEEDEVQPNGKVFKKVGYAFIRSGSFKVLFQFFT